MSWMCKRAGCGHNLSAHRNEPRLFSAEVDTSCKAYVRPSGPGDDRQCRCVAFLEEAP